MADAEVERCGGASVHACEWISRQHQIARMKHDSETEPRARANGPMHWTWQPAECALWSGTGVFACLDQFENPPRNQGACPT